MADDQTVEFMYEGRRCVLEYRDSNHSYWVSVEPEPAIRYVSNSTLSKVAYNDPGGLMGWTRKETLEGRDYRDSAKFAQECGNAAHGQLEALAQTGKPLDLSDQPERVRGALQATAKWWLDFSPTFVASEVIVCSPRLKCAGRFDFLAEVNGELVLGDLKTSEKDWEHFRKFKGRAAYAQLALYALCYGDMFSDKPQPVGRYILHVNTNGDYDFERDRAPDLSETSALSKIETYRADAEWDKADKAVRKYETKGQLAA